MPDTRNFAESAERYASIVVGAVLTGLALEFFYIPYGLIDGGMTGVAVVLGRTGAVPPVYVLTVVNLACLALGVWCLDPGFMGRAGAGLLAIVSVLWLIRPVPALLPPIAASIVGGITVGLGLGLVLRAGGALDGSEIIGLICRYRFGWSLVWFLFVFNLLVFALITGLFGLRISGLSILAQGLVQTLLAVILSHR